jgi:hypothetical protein
MIRSRLIVCGECFFRSPEAERETVMITKKRFGIVALWSIVMCVPSMSFAQHAPGSVRQHGAGREQGPAYDAKTEVTLTGTVGEVKTARNPRSNVKETRLFLKTDTGTVEIHLGPTAFLTEKKVTIRTGETLEVIGSRVTVGESQVVLARDVRKGGLEWTLRDAEGEPLWGALQPEKPRRWTMTRVLLLAALAGKIAAAVVLMS